MTFPRILDTSNATWSRAKKTKGLRAALASTLFADETFIGKVLLPTLEGNQKIEPTNMICIGETGDIWQQTPAALAKKYDVISTEGAWSICLPKPENEAECFEITSTSDGETFIVGLWGAEIEGVKNLQAFNIGDFVCRQPHDHSDQWIVRRGLFLNSYTIL